MELMLFCESPFFSFTEASWRILGAGLPLLSVFPKFSLLSCMRKRWNSKAGSLGIGEASSRNRKCTCGNTPIQEERRHRAAVERERWEGVGLVSKAVPSPEREARCPPFTLLM